MQWECTEIQLSIRGRIYKLWDTYSPGEVLVCYWNRGILELDEEVKEGYPQVKAWELRRTGIEVIAGLILGVEIIFERAGISALYMYVRFILSCDLLPLNPNRTRGAEFT